MTQPLNEIKNGEIKAKDGEIKTLSKEKMDIAHAAARMLCPKKKLADLDSMFKPRTNEPTTSQ